MTFPQLRIRTEFSFRNTFGPIPTVANHLAEIDCKTAGIVDSGTWGHVRWEKALKKLEIQPAFGSEFQVLINDFKPIAWCLAEELKSFYRFSSSRPNSPEAFGNAPAGVIRFSGAALTDPQHFDYIDLNPTSMRRAKFAVELARETNKKIVLTSDNNYPAPGDRNKFLAITDNKKMTPQHILAEKGELRKAFFFLSDEAFERAYLDTFEVAERLQGIALQQAPLIHVPGDLGALVEAGRQYRMEKGHITHWNKVYQQRLEREMAMIAEKDFASYFIVVADLVCWAKERMLVGPARGSSAGSLVCYLLRITEVDPLVHGLLFERFIDINRNDLPDIDIDFNDKKRHLCFEYLEQKYGADNIARIGSINTLGPKSVLAEVGKRLGISVAATFAVKNVLIEYSSGDARYGKGLEDTLVNTQPGRDFCEKYPEAKVMGEVENHAWHSGVHAAGIIVANVPVIEYCTVKDGVAQLDKPDAEYLNLLKIDALGLRTLGVIEDSGCVTSEFLYGLPLNDPKAFAILNDKKFSGVFQFEGAAQRRVSMQVLIDDFKKIDHVTALARPGPLGGGASQHYIERCAGREVVSFRHPTMAEYLGDTYGVVLYQEQVMRIAREIGKFSWNEVAIIRKAMSGSKGKEFFDQKGVMFLEGAATLGIPKEGAQIIWDEICSFGAWGMNACTVGSTRIKLAHPNQFLGTNPTIEELYKYYKINPSSWIRQRKAMPVLLCVGDDGIAKPRMAVDIYATGVKNCFRYTFSNGKKVECTEDHKFIINGKWKKIGKAKIGDLFSIVSRDKSSSKPLKGRQTGKKNGRCVAEREFRETHLGYACDDCFKIKKRMEVHHNDHKHGAERPADLAWLCSGCHKLRHIEAGDREIPYSRGWKPSEPVELLSVITIGKKMTYDIEMPNPNHNYVLANGIVTHNSHTCSYAMISYYCCYMKAYHPLEYAAACLRNAKDDEQVIEILRELSKEGVGFIPFDPMLSESNWCAKEGKLLGGYTNLHGIGPAKARAYIEKRDAGKLTEKDLEKLKKFPIKNSELSPAHVLYGDIYSDPDKYNIHGGVKEFANLKDGENAVVVCRVIRKERRDENEVRRIAKRDGERRQGQTLFLDVHVVDDSVSQPIVARIRPEKWFELGQPLADKAVDDVDWFLVRGRWLEQFSMMIVKKIKCLTQPEMFNA